MLSKDKTELNRDDNDNLPENNTQELVEQPSDSSEETLQEESVEETPVEETKVQEPEAEAPALETSTPETPPETIAAEAELPKEEVSVAEVPVVTPVAEETPQEEAPVAETPEEKAPVAEVSEPEEPAEEAGTEPTAEGEVEEDLEEGISEEAMLKQIEEILQNTADFELLVSQSNPQELILMLDYFYKAEEVQPYIKKVGSIKRAFDDLSEKEVQPAVVQARFSTALSRFNKKRSEYQHQQELEKAENSKKKRKLISRLKEIVEAQEMSRFDDVKEIQTTWKETGHVLREDMDDLNNTYRALLDDFYQQREIYFQLRDYDRQINLQEKERLLEELKTIIPAEEDQENREVWQEKNDLLTDIQLRWRAVGHVPREELDRINQEYRHVTEEFFNLRHEFYESQDQERQENADAKRELLEKMQEFVNFESDSPREWNDATDRLRDLQEAWKKVGRAPREANSELWKEYRAIGNAFFGGKAAFFQQLDNVRNENLDAKRELVERVEKLKDSPELEKTARELKQIQKEWKKIGPVPDRHSNKLWARFRKACDAFFEHRRVHYEALREEEVKNLESKKVLIEEVKAVSIEEAGSPEAAIAQIKEIQARWKAIGRVPFKDKDTIWEEFRAEIDQFFNDLRGNRDRRNYAKIKSTVESMPENKRTRTLKDKIAKVSRKIESSLEKIEQYSTNILYISKGKSGDPLREQIQGEIDKETRLVKDLKKQVRQMEELLRNPSADEEAGEGKKASKKGKAKAESAKVEVEDTAEAPVAETEAPAAEAPAAETEAAEGEVAAEAKQPEAKKEPKEEGEKPEEPKEEAVTEDEKSEA